MQSFGVRYRAPAHFTTDAHDYDCRRTHARFNLGHASPQAACHLVRLDATTAAEMVPLGQGHLAHGGQPRTGFNARFSQYGDGVWLVV
jgi:hypothetical protein